MATPINSHTEPTPLKLPYFVADKSGKYRARRALTEDQIIKAASVLLNKHIYRGNVLTSPDITRAYLSTQMRGLHMKCLLAYTWTINTA